MYLSESDLSEAGSYFHFTSGYCRLDFDVKQVSAPVFIAFSFLSGTGQFSENTVQVFPNMIYYLKITEFL